MNLSRLQYNCIGTVAQHCDSNKLCISENEASNYDLAELFCDFWYKIEQIDIEIQAYILNPELPLPENYQSKYNLLFGGTFLDCDNKPRVFGGVYKTLAMYSYSRYVILNGFSDTPNGVVTKTNEFSIPKSLKELETFADKYRNMGRIEFKRTQQYLCANKTIFAYDDCPKGKCGCGAKKCSEGTLAKGYGFKGRNIG